MELVKDCRLRNKILRRFGFTGDIDDDINQLIAYRKISNEDFKCFLKELKYLFMIYILFTPIPKDEEYSFINRLRFISVTAQQDYFIENIKQLKQLFNK